MKVDSFNTEQQAQDRGNRKERRRQQAIERDAMEKDQQQRSGSSGQAGTGSAAARSGAQAGTTTTPGGSAPPQTASDSQSGPGADANQGSPAVDTTNTEDYSYPPRPRSRAESEPPTFRARTDNTPEQMKDLPHLPFPRQSAGNPALPSVSEESREDPPSNADKEREEAQRREEEHRRFWQSRGAQATTEKATPSHQSQNPTSQPDQSLRDLIMQNQKETVAKIDAALALRTADDNVIASFHEELEKIHDALRVQGSKIQVIGDLVGLPAEAGEKTGTQIAQDYYNSIAKPKLDAIRQSREEHFDQVKASYDKLAASMEDAGLTNTEKWAVNYTSGDPFHLAYKLAANVPKTPDRRPTNVEEQRGSGTTTTPPGILRVDPESFARQPAPPLASTRDVESRIDESSHNTRTVPPHQVRHARFEDAPVSNDNRARHRDDRDLDGPRQPPNPHYRWEHQSEEEPVYRRRPWTLPKKSDLPEFNGNGSQLPSWLAQIETYLPERAPQEYVQDFLDHRLPAILTGDAQQWWFYAKPSLHNWNDVHHGLKERFLPKGPMLRQWVEDRVFSYSEPVAKYVADKVMLTRLYNRNMPTFETLDYLRQGLPSALRAYMHEPLYEHVRGDPIQAFIRAAEEGLDRWRHVHTAAPKSSLPAPPSDIRDLQAFMPLTSSSRPKATAHATDADPRFRTRETPPFSTSSKSRDYRPRPGTNWDPSKVENIDGKDTYFDPDKKKVIVCDQPCGIDGCTAYHFRWAHHWLLEQAMKKRKQTSSTRGTAHVSSRDPPRYDWSDSESSAESHDSSEDHGNWRTADPQTFNAYFQRNRTSQSKPANRSSDDLSKKLEALVDKAVAKLAHPAAANTVKNAADNAKVAPDQAGKPATATSQN